jgi:Flp pilus assembly protein TadD
MRAHRLRTFVGLLALAALAGCADAPRGQGPAALTTSPLGLDGQLRLAGAALSGGDTVSALGLLQQAVAAEPRSAGARQALADAYYAAGAFPEAEQAYRELGTLEGGADASLLGLARTALARGDLPVAIARFEQARRAGPRNPAAINGLAVAYDLSGRHREAQALYATVLAQDPTNRATLNNLALSLALSGDAKAAIGRLSALVYGPTVIPQARHNLALALGLAGDEEGARSLLGRDLARGAIEDNLAFYRMVRAAGEGAPLPAVSAAPGQAS